MVSVVLRAGDRSRTDAAAIVDLRNADMRGPFKVITGRVPSAPHEIAVGPELAAEGFPVGSTVLVKGAGPRTIVGVLTSPRILMLGVVAPPGALSTGDPSNEVIRPTPWPSPFYLAFGPEIPWSSVQHLNAIGATALSRAVVLDPPPAAPLDHTQQIHADAGAREAAAVLGLIVVMALLEVALLAGPAFALGARRMGRTLALVAATGGTPRQIPHRPGRRDARGISGRYGRGGTWRVAGRPRDGGAPRIGVEAAEQWGPFQVSARNVAVIAAVGGLSALVAAVVPAFLASRQSVVAGLQGRRLPVGGARRWALAGVLFLLVGVLGMLVGVGVLDNGPFAGSEILIAAAAIPTALGAAVLAPAVLALAGRTAPRLALPLRYAVRDADRQRGRTAPAVAAITATVAGLVAVGTAANSDHTEGRLRYQPSGPYGFASVTGISPDNLDAALGVVRRVTPEATVHQLSSVSAGFSSDSTSHEVRLCRPAPNGRCEPIRLQSALPSASKSWSGSAP